MVSASSAPKDNRVRVSAMHDQENTPMCTVWPWLVDTAAGDFPSPLGACDRCSLRRAYTSEEAEENSAGWVETSNLSYKISRGRDTDQKLLLELNARPGLWLYLEIVRPHGEFQV